jgi:BirA family transcriptional regulator, biotin operon repressor / biotin---[acetyl-CoA-carboxylase] ligase
MSDKRSSPAPGADITSFIHQHSGFRVREVWSLESRRLGGKVLLFDQVDSTNTLAASLAGQPGTVGVALLSDEQHAGRGQQGRVWLAPPRSSVLLSVLLSPPPHVSRPAILTVWAAVSVCALVQRLTGLSPCIKWPNDVLIRGRKVCGILIEQSQHGRTPFTVAGIGLNVTQSEEQFAAAGLPLATSLQANGANTTDTHTVARLLLAELDEQFDRLCQGDLTTLELSWQRSLNLVGKSVIAECIDGARVGTLIQVGFAGIVLSQPEHGHTVLPPESILHLSAT